MRPPLTTGAQCQLRRHERCVEVGLIVHATGDCFSFTQPLINTEEQLGEMFTLLRRLDLA
jgi:adenosylmethionine-8-amino-7-oxononanoate aminotransferase